MTAAIDLNTLRRPGLLVRAARIQSEGPSEAVYRQALGTTGPLTDAARVDRLIKKESEANEKRLTGDATYSIARHITFLAALILEARRIGPRLA